MYLVYLKGVKQPVVMDNCNICYTPADLPDSSVHFFTDNEDQEHVASFWYPDIEVIMTEDPDMIGFFLKPVSLN